MVVVLPKTMSFSAENKGLTHFLRIPFATTKSTPQLLKSLDQIARDPLAAELPRAAWSAPDQVHYTFAQLSLKTPARIAAASQLLRSFPEEYSKINSFISSSK